MDNRKTQFTLKGFTQVLGRRVFEFEGVTADRTRSLFTVSADLALSRRYAIRLQELPLLCRSFLERCYEGEEQQEFAYTEEEMRLYADGVTAREEAAKLRRSPRRPASQQVGAAWRTHPL